MGRLQSLHRAHGEGGGAAQDSGVAGMQSAALTLLCGQAVAIPLLAIWAA